MSKEKYLSAAESYYQMFEQDLMRQARYWEYSMYLNLFAWAGWKE